MKWRSYEESVIHILFYSIIVFVIIIDQLSKYIVRQTLEVGTSIEIWEGVLHLTHIQNSGAALGLFEGYGRLFVPIAILVAVVGIYLYNKGHLEGKLMKIGTAFFIGGAIGNAIDRILFNQVTDFIDFQYNNGIPNLADYALQIGVVFLFLDMILDSIKKKKVTDTFE